MTYFVSKRRHQVVGGKIVCERLQVDFNLTGQWSVVLVDLASNSSSQHLVIINPLVCCEINDIVGIRNANGFVRIGDCDVCTGIGSPLATLIVTTAWLSAIRL